MTMGMQLECRWNANEMQMVCNRNVIGVQMECKWYAVGMHLVYRQYR